MLVREYSLMIFLLSIIIFYNGMHCHATYKIPHWLERGTKLSFTRVWKPLSSRRVLKP